MLPSSMSSRELRQLGRVREVIRIKHYSIRTEHAYLQWIRRYIHFHQKRHPRELGAGAVSTFRRRSSASLQQGSRTLTIRASDLAARLRPWRARLAAKERSARELSVRKLGL
jgi:hypothetical protein